MLEDCSRRYLASFSPGLAAHLCGWKPQDSPDSALHQPVNLATIIVNINTVAPHYTATSSTRAASGTSVNLPIVPQVLK